LDFDVNTKHYSVGNKFLAHKEKLNGVRNEIEKTFSNIMKNIKTNFRDLIIVGDDTESITNYNWMGKWQCEACTVVNPMKEERCTTCDAPKPK
jgi:hypothetical protein